MYSKSHHFWVIILVYWCLGFPGGSDGKESACNAGDPGSIPESGKSPGEENGNPLQYSCLENSMDRGAGLVIVHGVSKSQTRLSSWHILGFVFSKLLLSIVSVVEMLSNDVLLHIPSQFLDQWYNVGILNSTMLRIFKTQKLANAPSQGFFLLLFFFSFGESVVTIY